MEYNNCLLYGLQSKKNLARLLHIDDRRFFQQGYVASLIEPYIDTRGKPRLIEPPSRELKRIQRNIKALLGVIKVPDNVFSGIKGRSYSDNAKLHVGNNLRNVYAIDLTAFFPSTSRETVYRFFRDDLRCSPDVAEILSNLTTIDIDKSVTKDIGTVNLFLNQKGVKTRNHLISGAPTSQLLSYLANHNLFDELQALADKSGITMSIYVDDVAFSSEHRISGKFRSSVATVVKKYNFQLSESKIGLYGKRQPKIITGVVINAQGNISVKNSLRKKIIDEYGNLRESPDDLESRQRLRGLVVAARQVDQSLYPNIMSFAFNKQVTAPEKL